MLDRLPIELLREIFDKADLFSLRQRNLTLYACCLVSKLIRKAAQPALWRTICWERSDQFQSILAGSCDGDNGVHTRTLSIELLEREHLVGADELASGSSGAYRLLAAIPRLEEVFCGTQVLRPEDAIQLCALTGASSSPSSALPRLTPSTPVCSA
jgi:hypothetical protein